MVDLWSGGSLGMCLLVETHYDIFKKGPVCAYGIIVTSWRDFLIL